MDIKRVTPDPMERIERYRGRFFMKGLDYYDIDRIKNRIDSWDRWCEVFSEYGDIHAELGHAAREDESYIGAEEHFLRASMYYHFGTNVWFEDLEERQLAHSRCVETFQRAGEYGGQKFQRLDIPYPNGGFEVASNLRIPQRESRQGQVPLVLLLPGLDANKEEQYPYAKDLLNRGLATLTLDGPGQGETWYHRGMSPEYSDVVSTVIDYLERENYHDTNSSRIGVFGVSLGGFYAPQAAARDHRISACVGISGPFSIGPISPLDSDFFKNQFKWACKTDSMVEVDDITSQMTLRDDIDGLDAPSLFIAGSEDEVISPTQTELIAEKARNSEFILYEGGNHCCKNYGYKLRPQAADWLARVLAG